MRLLRVHAFLALLSLSSVSAFAATPKTSCDELRRLELTKDPGLIVLDVRPPRDFAQGHIQDAQNIMAEALDSASFPRDKRLVVYCSEDTCSLSASAANKLISLGYTNVSLLDGGFNDWLKHHYPAQTGSTVPNRPNVDRISVDEARKWIEDGTVLILDVRPMMEFNAGHLAGASNAPLEELDSVVKGLTKDRDILIYDRLDGRSRQAAKQLAAAGFKVTELSGGIAGWIMRKLPLEVK